MSERIPSTSSGVETSRSEPVSRELRRAQTRYASRIAQSISFGTLFDLPSEDAQRLSSSNLIKRYFWRLCFFLSTIKEPKPTGLLASIVQSKPFELSTLMVIVLNGILVLYQTELAARTARGDLARQQGDEVDLVFVIDQLFTVYFVSEILLRLLVHQLYFFCNDDCFWNIFDLTIVVSTVLEVLMSLIGDASDGMDTTLLRVLRIFRMFKSLRLVRTLHFVRPLRQLVECMVASLAVVFWCMLLLVLVTGIFATFLVQCVTAYLVDDGPAELAVSEAGQEDLARLTGAFGSIVSAMWALFKATSGGQDWAIYYDVLSYTGAIAPLVYVVYIVFFFISAWNMVSSLFMEKVMALAQPDMDQQLLAKRRQDIADAKDLKSLLETFDQEQSGTISLEVFTRSLARPRIRHFFELRNIDVKDAEAFFAMLEAAAGSSSIGLDVVVHGLMRMRGVATNMDLQALQFQLQVDKAKISQSLKDIREALKSSAAEPREASRKALPALGGAGEGEALHAGGGASREEEEEQPDCPVCSNCSDSEALVSL